MRLDQIWKYPVKSMLGGRVETADLAGNGIVGDRMFALRDVDRGAIASARKIAGLTRLSANEAAGGGVVITLPDGSSVTDSDDDVNARVSAAVQHPVALTAKPPAENTAHWRRGRADTDDFLAEMRSIFGRLPDEPLPDFSVFPPEMVEYEYPPGNYFDCYPLMIMSTSALRSIQAALPDSLVDERRFRPSLVVDTGDDDGHPEFAWSGRTMRIGSTELAIGSPCPRCAIVTRAFGDDLPADTRVLRHVVRDLDQSVGVYATVVSGGAIAVGDSVDVV